jgi:hypothetical protein
LGNVDAKLEAAAINSGEMLFDKCGGFVRDV